MMSRPSQSRPVERLKKTRPSGNGNTFPNPAAEPPVSELESPKLNSTGLLTHLDSTNAVRNTTNEAITISPTPTSPPISLSLYLSLPPLFATPSLPCASCGGLVLYIFMYGGIQMRTEGGAKAKRFLVTLFLRVQLNPGIFRRAVE